MEVVEGLAWMEIGLGVVVAGGVGCADVGADSAMAVSVGGAS